MLPATEPVALPADLLAVGRVTGSYGIRGWIRIEAHNRPQDSVLLQVRHWWLRGPDVIRGGGIVRRVDPPVSPPVRCEVASARVHGAGLVAKPAQIHDRERAEALKGCEILISRGDFPKGEPDEVYWTDLIGCEVGNPAGEALGRVFAVEDYGAHPVLRLRDDQGVERMIPFVAAHVLSVDVAARRVIADWQLDY